MNDTALIIPQSRFLVLTRTQARMLQDILEQVALRITLIDDSRSLVTVSLNLRTVPANEFMLDRLLLCSPTSNDALAFLDPADVVPSTHVIPQFSLGEVSLRTPKSRWVSNTDAVWKVYFINRVTDRETYTRYQYTAPADVIRSTHLIPQFSLGEVSLRTPKSRWVSNTDAVREVYFINTFTDRDTYMRYHHGMAVGSTYSTQFLSPTIPSIPTGVYYVVTTRTPDRTPIDATTAASAPGLPGVNTDDASGQPLANPVGVSTPPHNSLAASSSRLQGPGTDSHDIRVRNPQVLLSQTHDGAVPSDIGSGLDDPSALDAQSDAGDADEELDDRGVEAYEELSVSVSTSEATDFN